MPKLKEGSSATLLWFALFFICYYYCYLFSTPTFDKEPFYIVLQGRHDLRVMPFPVGSLETIQYSSFCNQLQNLTFFDALCSVPRENYAEAMKKLTPKEKMIISKRFFDGRTQMEVAEEIGISQAQVSRIEKAAIEHIKRIYKWRKGTGVFHQILMNGDRRYNILLIFSSYINIM